MPDLRPVSSINFHYDESPKGNYPFLVLHCFAPETFGDNPTFAIVVHEVIYGSVVTSPVLERAKVSLAEAMILVESMASYLDVQDVYMQGTVAQVRAGFGSPGDLLQTGVGFRK